VEEGAAEVEAGVGEDLERRVGEEEAAVLVLCQLYECFDVL
jgi:hypothetical protein